MTYTLVALSGPREGSSFPCTASMVVGRADDCDVSIPDQRLSRHHARLVVAGAQLWVEDLGSPNGTRVNERRLRKCELKEGDVVSMGRTRFRVHVGEGVAEDAHQDLIKEVRGYERVPGTSVPPIEEYYEAFGLGDDTLLDVSAERFAPLLRKARDFAVLHQISTSIQRLTDPHEVLGQVLDWMLQLGGADRGFVALLDEHEDPVIEVVRHGSHPPRISTADCPVRVSQTVAHHVLAERCAVLCGDAASDPRFQAAESLLLSQTRSLMAVPILVGPRAIGLIQLESSHLGARFTEADLDFLTIVSSTVGVALDNLRLAQRREETIRALEEAQANLVATQERLIHAERMAAVGRFAAGISHEIKNHLSPFMLASLIARKYPDDAEVQASAEIMHEAQQHILDLVSELRAFVSGSQTSYELGVHDLGRIVEGVVRFLKCDRAVARIQVAVEVVDRPVVEVDEKSIRQVLVNLIRNAAEAVSDEGGRVLVRVLSAEASAWDLHPRSASASASASGSAPGSDLASASGLAPVSDPASASGSAPVPASAASAPAPASGWAVVEVVDNGPGIPPSVGQRIFDPFFSTKPGSGLGLGLDISKKIVSDHGGSLTFASGVDGGTVFKMALPVSEFDD
ncbi:MAG: FHA domain-containing protein [Deltaproteobacteria bacterium]|nr:FHA domain-containing protein [Deltaproteobacteria bacterium]